MTLASGTKLGPYEIHSQLGAGGMGEVYRARDPRLGRTVAIKVLSAESTRKPENLFRFEQEAKAASALNHPNILTVYDVGEADGTRYIATEFVEGQTLRYLAPDSRTLLKALDIALQTANALAAAHAAGIVHRDIKPENIMLRPDGYVKVLDFGLAKLAEPSFMGARDDPHAPTAGLTQVGQVMGTWRYMSPEQVRGRDVDARTDIWSLGAVLYEMVCGRSPFQGPTVSDTVAAILCLEPPAVTHASKDVPPELEHILEKALAKDREERYQSAKDMAIDLKRLKSDIEMDTSAGRFTRPHTPTSASRRDINSLAVLPLSNYSQDKEQDYFVDGMTEILITALAKLGGLDRVISRNSVMRYKETTKSLVEIARELRVDAFVTGAVMRSGNRVRIDAQLIDPNTDRHLWVETYEGDLCDAFALQSRVALNVAQSINLHVNPQAAAQLARNSPVNPAAQDAYLRGRFYWNKRDADSVRTGLKYFEEAVREDPKYALGHVGIADSCLVLINFGADSQDPWLVKAREACNRALELDPDLAEAHSSLACIHCMDHLKLEDAEKEFQISLRLNPSYATASHWYARLLCLAGRLDEALVKERRALELDSLSPVMNAFLGYIRYLRREPDLAIQHLHRTVEMHPNFWLAHMTLAQAHMLKGETATAIAEAEKARELPGGGAFVLSVLGYIYASSSEKNKALQVLAELDQMAAKGHVLPPPYAIIYAALDHDQAFQWLNRGLEESTLWTLFLKSEPLLDGLRPDPRFADLLKRAGLA
jgi:serine/threonine protein kinase/Flp pilus assembly protein TadD